MGNQLLNFKLVFLLLGAIGSVRASCTHAAIKKAMTCTNTLKREFGAANSPDAAMVQGDASKAVRACGNGNLLTAINCIERVVEECRYVNSDEAHFLLGMIDIERARRTVNFFCTNVKVYVANYQCITGNHSELNTCAGEARKNYETQTKATQNMDVLMRFQCIFYQEVVKCVDKVLTRKCSSAAADIAKTTITGFEPPICTNMSGGVKSERAGSYDILIGDSHVNSAIETGCHSIIHTLIALYSLILLLK
ncbi:hypothetical protein BsWGS_11840 [Bradybaena similaris]